MKKIEKIITAITQQTDFSHIKVLDHINQLKKDLHYDNDDHIIPQLLAQEWKVDLRHDPMEYLFPILSFESDIISIEIIPIATISKEEMNTKIGKNEILNAGLWNFFIKEHIAIILTQTDWIDSRTLSNFYKTVTQSIKIEREHIFYKNELLLRFTHKIPSNGREGWSNHQWAKHFVTLEESLPELTLEEVINQAILTSSFTPCELLKDPPFDLNGKVIDLSHELENKIILELLGQIPEWWTSEDILAVFEKVLGDEDGFARRKALRIISQIPFWWEKKDILGFYLEQFTAESPVGRIFTLLVQIPSWWEDKTILEAVLRLGGREAFFRTKIIEICADIPIWWEYTQILRFILNWANDYTAFYTGRVKALDILGRVPQWWERHDIYSTVKKQIRDTDVYVSGKVFDVFGDIPNWWEKKEILNTICEQTKYCLSRGAALALFGVIPNWWEKEALFNFVFNALNDPKCPTSGTAFRLLGLIPNWWENRDLLDFVLDNLSGKHIGVRMACLDLLSVTPNWWDNDRILNAALERLSDDWKYVRKNIVTIIALIPYWWKKEKVVSAIQTNCYYTDQDYYSYSLQYHKAKQAIKSFTPLITDIDDFCWSGYISDLISGKKHEEQSLVDQESSKTIRDDQWSLLGEFVRRIDAYPSEHVPRNNLNIKQKYLGKEIQLLPRKEVRSSKPSIIINRKGLSFVDQESGKTIREVSWFKIYEIRMTNISSQKSTRESIPLTKDTPKIILRYRHQTKELASISFDDYDIDEQDYTRLFEEIEKTMKYHRSGIKLIPQTETFCGFELELFDDSHFDQWMRIR
ncbi:MAG: hypothetical protein ACXADY_16870 [Candidatus Hodarchaeales archaeon]|jgi:hypothetical protein